MKFTHPEVFLIGLSGLHLDGIQNWFSFMGVNKDPLEFLQGEPSPIEHLIELAARRCYKSFEVGLNPNISKIREDPKEYFKNILSSGHGSVLEHAHATFAFEGVSRVFTHEMVRNTIGIKNQDGNEEDITVPRFALSQESLRYVRFEDIPIWIPSTIAEYKDPEVLELFIDTIEHCENNYKKLVNKLGLTEAKTFEEKKRLTSLLRRIIPMGIATGIVITFNMRALRWVLEQRTSQAAEQEMRIVFNQVGNIALQEWPYIFQDFSKIDTQDDLYEFIPEYRKV